MKKLLILCIILLLLFSPAYAQETGEETEEEAVEVEEEARETEAEAPVEEEEAKEDLALFTPAFRNVDVTQLNENQMALLMINHQIEYLMLQIQDKEAQLREAAGNQEAALQRERDQQEQLKKEHGEKIAQAEEKFAAKEAELAASREELHALEKRVAAFLGDSGLYLVALIAAISGIVIGLILSAILNRRRGSSAPAKNA